MLIPTRREESGPAPSLPVLLFDLGGVLVQSRLFRSLRALIDSSISDLELSDSWMRSTAVRQFECGRLDALEFGSRIIEELGVDMKPDDFLSAFATWSAGFYPGAELLLTRLRRTFRVGCLSNCNVLHWSPQIESQFDFAYSSHLIGRVKPDVEAFEHVVSEQDVPAASIVFFDNSLTNVRAARMAGLDAHHTVGFEGLLSVLRQEGIE